MTLIERARSFLSATEGNATFMRSVTAPMIADMATALETQAAEIARLRGLLGEAEGALGIFAVGEIRSLTDEEDIPDAARGSVAFSMGELRLARTTLAKLRAEKEDG